MFIRKRHVKGPNGAIYTYYAIVETHRIEGKPRQKLLYNMGKRSTIVEAIAHEQKHLDMFESWIREDRPLTSTHRTCARIRSRIEWLKSVVSKVERSDLEHYTSDKYVTGRNLSLGD